MSASGRLGKVIDMSWVPLPHPVGAGSVLAVAVEDGSLAFIEASQAAESSTKRQRLASFKHLIGGGFPYPQISQTVLTAPPPPPFPPGGRGIGSGICGLWLIPEHC